MKKTLLIFCLCIYLPLTSLLSQELDFVLVDSISISGLKKTKPRIVFRELRFKIGDTISLENLTDLMEESEFLLMNTYLFNGVKIYFKNWEGNTNKIHFQIDVIESWYLYPIPVFELADRNFNVWWTEQGRSLSRVNIGLEFAHLNFTGGNDRLKVGFKYGYTQSLSMSYRIPFINKAQTIGFNTSFTFRRNRELNYLSIDNRQEFYQEDNNFVFQKYQGLLALIYRPKLRVFHELTLGYTNDQIASIISEDLNPVFFSNRDNLQNFFQLGYQMRIDYRDLRAYPWSGYQFTGSLIKDGLGVFSDRNALTLNLGYDQYVPFTSKVSVGLQSKVKWSVIRDQQSYQYNRGLGFGGDYLRGYEFYIVDGLDMGYLRSSLRFNVFNAELQFGRIVPLEAFRYMPIRLFFSVNNDFGMVNDPFSGDLNPLSNKLLWGRGIGLDVLLFNNKLIQIQYSFNDLRENGLFLHLDLNL